MFGKYTSPMDVDDIDILAILTPTLSLKSSNIWTMEAWKTTPVSFQRRTVKLRGVYRQSKLWNQRNNVHRIYMSWIEDGTILFVWCDLFHQQFRLWLFGFNGRIDIQGYTSAMDPVYIVYLASDVAKKNISKKKTWICMFDAWKESKVFSQTAVWWWFTMVESVKNNQQKTNPKKKSTWLAGSLFHDLCEIMPVTQRFLVGPNNVCCLPKMRSNLSRSHGSGGHTRISWTCGSSRLDQVDPGPMKHPRWAPSQT